MLRVLANVYLRDGSNRRILTTPGRSVQFFGGHASVVDHRDMPHMLQLANALVQPTPEAMAWAADWLRNTREIKAETQWPEGWTVEFVNPSEFLVYFTETSTYERLAVTQATPTVSQPVETVDMTPRPAGWINPALLLEEPEEPVGAAPKPSRKRGT